MFTKGDAENIGDKLKAVYEEGRNHTIAIFYYKGARILSFGIRRGSRKDQGHDYLPRQLHLTPRHTRRLADCPMSLREYVGLLKNKGIIPPDPDETEASN